MHRPEEFLHRCRWQPVYNAGSVEIPPFGVMYTSRSTTTVDGTLQATSPLSVDNYNHNLLSFNGPAAIPVQGYGSCTQDYPCLARVDADAPNGTILGTQANESALFSEDDGVVAPFYFGLYRGFRSLGMVGDYALVVPQAQGQCCRGVGIPEELCLTFVGTPCTILGLTACDPSALTLTYGAHTLWDLGLGNIAYGWGYTDVTFTGPPILGVVATLHQAVLYCSSHLAPYGLQPPPYYWVLYYVCRNLSGACRPTTTALTMSCDPFQLTFDATPGVVGTFTITECP